MKPRTACIASMSIKTKAQATNQRGQLGVFIIVAILMLLALAALLLLAVTQRQRPGGSLSRVTTFDSLTHDVENYIQGCMSMKAAEPITRLGLQGGRLTPNTGIFFNGTELHELCRYTSNKGCVSTVTTQASLEQELKRELTQEISSCLDIAGEFKITGATFTTGTRNLNVTISVDTVTLDLAYPVSLTLGPNQRDLSHFTSTVQTPLGRMFRTALDIANSQAGTGFFDKETYMANHDTSILIEAYRPYPNIVYQLKRKDPQTQVDFVFQFAIAGKDTAGTEALTWEPANGCCFANDNTCHTNAPAGSCPGKSEAKGCNCPANAKPEIEGCCTRSDGTCAVTHPNSCTASQDHYVENDLLCSQSPGCASLDCEKTYDMPSRSMNGRPRKNGESWCIYDGPVGNGNDLVGSRHYLHSCVRAKEYVEPCRDYREELCTESRISTPGGFRSHAACRINRFADCTSQGNQDQATCKDKRVRDCEWLPSAYATTGVPVYNHIKCIPTTAPGLKFWEGAGRGICRHSSDGSSPNPKRKRTFAYQVQHACAKSGDCGAKRNIDDKLTKGGYFNPDGDLEDDKLVPQHGEHHIAYPGLGLSMDDWQLPSSLPNLGSLASGGGHAICNLWQQDDRGDCSLCTANPLHPCSEYICKSLRQSCEYSENRLGIPTCTAGSAPLAGQTIPIITNLEGSPSRLQRTGGSDKTDEYNAVPALKMNEPFTLAVETNQPTRCKITLLSKDLAREAKNTWILCIPGRLDLCLHITTIYFSNAGYKTKHVLTMQLPFKNTFITAITAVKDPIFELPDLMQGFLQEKLREFISNSRPIPIYLRCQNSFGTETKEAELKIHVSEGRDKPPKILAVRPRPETVRIGDTVHISLFSDNTFTECNVKNPDGSTSKLCGEVKPLNIQFRSDAPAGTYECSGSNLELTGQRYIFSCSDEHGKGPDFIYTPEEARSSPFDIGPAEEPAPHTVPGCIIGCGASGWTSKRECQSGNPDRSSCCKDGAVGCFKSEVTASQTMQGHDCGALRTYVPFCD